MLVNLCFLNSCRVGYVTLKISLKLNKNEFYLFYFRFYKFAE